MIIEITERCRCGAFLSLFESGGRWHVTCLDRCYDPAEDAGPIASLIGCGETPGDAIADYLRLREDADIEPVYVPTGLYSFVVPSHPGRLRVLTEYLDGIEEAEQFAAAFRSDTCVMLGPSPIFFEPALPRGAANDNPSQKASNQ